MGTPKTAPLPKLTLDEKVEFVNSLVERVRRQAVQSIMTERVPVHWAGAELRRMLADKFEAETMPLTGARAQDYRSVRDTVGL